MSENSFFVAHSRGDEVQRSACLLNVRDPGMDRPVILIVEDEAILAEDLKEVLQDYGYEVCAIAQTGEQALAGFSQFQPDLILMDIHLPGTMDGIDVAARITKNFPVPVLYLTAFFDGETIARATQTNPYGFLVKPFKKETVHSSIQVALARNRLDTKIRSSREWIDLTFKNIDRGIIVLDKEGRIVLINSFTERLLGVPFNTLHQKAFVDEIRFYDTILHKRYVPADFSVLNEGLISIIPPDILLVSGKGKTLRIRDGTISPVSDERGSIHGALFVFTTETGTPETPGFRKTPADIVSTGKEGTSLAQGENSLQRMTIQEVKGDIAISISLEKANLCVLLGKFEEAIGIYDQMLKDDPGDFQVWYNRGVVQIKLGRHGEALRSFEKALVIRPDSNEALCRKTEVLAIRSMKKRRT